MISELSIQTAEFLVQKAEIQFQTNSSFYLENV